MLPLTRLIYEFNVLLSSEFPFAASLSEFHFSGVMLRLIEISARLPLTVILRK